MDGLSTQEIDTLTASIRQYSGSIGTYANSLKERGDAERRLSNELNRKARGASEALGALTGSASNASRYFANLVGGGLVGAAFMKLISVGNDLTNTYREMMNVGQSFNGSLLDMSMAAAAAGMPLDEFAEAVKTSSKVAARLGMKDFVALQKGVNKTMMRFGMFGMTQQQVTEHMGAYLETQRRMGLTEQMTLAETEKSFVDLMATTSGLSKATGVARNEITQLAQAAIGNSMAMSRIALMSESEAKNANKKFQESMAVLASQAGEAGRFLSGLHAEAFGTANAAFTEQGKTLISVGLGHLGTMFENAKTPEDTIRAQEQFRKELTANLPLLRSLALGTGESASAARQLMQVQADMSKLTVEDYNRKKKEAAEQDGITKIFTSFRWFWNQMTGDFRTGFLKGFKPLFESVGDFTKSSKLKKFSEAVGVMGEKLGKMMGSLLTFILEPGRLEKIGNGLSSFGQFLYDLPWKEIGVGMVTIGGGIALLAGVKWGVLGAAISGVATLLAHFSGVLDPLVKLMNEHKLATGFVIAGIWGVGKLFKMLSAGAGIASMFRRNAAQMDVNAAVVNINGGGVGPDLGGGPGGGGGNGRQRGNFRRGARGRMARRWRAGGVRGVARGMKGGLKAGGKSLLKKIPGLGILAGLGFGAQRAMGGDWLGAGGEVLSGVLGSIPGIGTAASLAIDGGLAARDAGLFNRGNATPHNQSGGSKLGKMGKVAMGVGAAGALGVAGYGLYEALSASQGTPEVKTPENDPLVKEMKEVNKKLDSLNHTMVAGQQTVARKVEEQNRSINQVLKRPPA